MFYLWIYSYNLDAMFQDPDLQIDAMRTNFSSGGSSVNLEDVISSVSTVTSETDLQYKKTITQNAKFFGTRLIQVLVQSRTNENYHLPCVVTQQNSDWFNVRIDELGEVAAQIKRNEIIFPPEMAEVTIDFFLYTADQDVLPLESWCFSVEPLSRKDNIPDYHKSDFYHQLGTLLKSAMVSARMTPMHRYYVKKQSADTFVILYRISNGPSTIDLGSDAKRLTLGTLPTRIGVFNITLAYRTRMEIDRTLTPIVDNSDSFQQISATSPGMTPDSGNSTWDHLCRSVAIAISARARLQRHSHPCNLHQKIATLEGSRACSTTSEADTATISTSQKERNKIMAVSQAIQKIPKGIPFANLLTLSYTGTLFPTDHLKEKESCSEDNDNGDSCSTVSTTSMASTLMGGVLKPSGETNASDSDDDGDELKPVQRPRKITMIPLRPLELTLITEDVAGSPMSKTVKAEDKPYLEGHCDADTTLNADETLIADKENEPIPESLSEFDDESFVKIPIFSGSNSNSDSNVQDSNLGELISSCKRAPSLESVVPEDLSQMAMQLNYFSQHQGIFDRFVAEVKEIADRDD